MAWRGGGGGGAPGGPRPPGTNQGLPDPRPGLLAMWALNLCEQCLRRGALRGPSRFPLRLMLEGSPRWDFQKLGLGAVCPGALGWSLPPRRRPGGLSCGGGLCGPGFSPS